MNNIFVNTILLFIGISLLSACSSNEQYRDQYSVCAYKKAGDCSTHSLQLYGKGADDEYHLGFVEYDDQGQLRDPEQLKALVNNYQQLAVNDDVLIISFIHGWHHSAKPQDGNVKSFHGMLKQLSQMEAISSSQQARKKRKVVGVYIGWRGDSIDIPVVNHLTFWDRKNTAHDVGQHGVTELLLKLEEIVNVKIGIEDGTPPTENSRFVVIGHSFGGAMLYTSIQKILTDRFIDSRRGQTFQGDAKGFADLVVLVNPAFEAMRFASLYDLSQQGCRNYFSSQLPKLLILTSETDYATKYAFSIGRAFSTVFESHVELERHYCQLPGSAGKVVMKISEGSADRNAVGHYQPYLTHYLYPTETVTLRNNNFEIKQLQTIWAQHTNDKPVDFNRTKLKSFNRTRPLNPYLNVKVDEQLIDGHNDIWGNDIIAFINDMIVISTIPAN